MDAQFIKEALGYVDLDITKVDKTDNVLHVYGCSSLDKGINSELLVGKKVVDRRVREIRELPVFKFRVVLHITVRKFVTEANEYFWEELSFVRKGSHFSKNYELQLFNRCLGSDIKRVALQDDIGIDTLQGIYHYYAEKNSQK